MPCTFFLNMYILKKGGLANMGAVAQMPTNTRVQLVYDFKCLVIGFVYGSLGASCEMEVRGNCLVLGM
jgi:hypothetical protein